MPTQTRVDELESEVEQLKATVQGLTEELVEAHERIRQVECALAGDSDAAAEAAREAAAEVADDVEAAVEEAGPAEIAEVVAGTDLGADDADGGEDDKKAGGDGDDEAEGELDDIIVA